MIDADESPPTGTVPWADTYREHAPRLIRLATVLVGSDDARDLVTEAVALAVHSSAWPAVREPGAYLVRTLVNASTSWHRSSGRRVERERRTAAAEVAPPFDPTALLDVRDALARLSPQQRAVVFLAYWEDLSIPEIARWLDVGEGTVRRQLDRAKTKLREVLR
jgi:RNA polymerase sigma-70 factor (ECF subfamily)